MARMLAAEVEGEMRSQHLFVAAVAALLATSAQASVQISSSPTQNMNCADGVCSPTAKKANLNATDLANMLATTDVKVVTGSGAVTIGILSPLTWASTNRLTLDANESVNIKAPVVVEGTAGLTIITNDGGTGGDLIFYGKGNVTFWDLSSSLAINGNSYTLVGDIASLAVDIANNPSGSLRAGQRLRRVSAWKIHPLSGWRRTYGHVRGPRSLNIESDCRARWL